MRTEFSSRQKTDRRIRQADEILRKCVHCGFCLSVCPTYLILGDERDSPRGRIYLIKEMLERDRPPARQTALHLDRCLSCNACQTSCPSGVDYQQLMDDGRAFLHEKLERSWPDRLMRAFLAYVLPRPELFRWGLIGARLIRPLAPLLGRRLASMLTMGATLPPAQRTAQRMAQRMAKGQRVYPAQGTRRMRVALMTGCVQNVLRPSINQATVRLLTRHGCEVVIPEGGACCGALVHHLGRVEESHRWAANNIRAWTAEINGQGLDAIVANASGCGAHVKRYGLDLAENKTLAVAAGRVAALTRDITEVITTLGLAPSGITDLPKIAYHQPCSLRHGQNVHGAPETLLQEAGFGLLPLPDEFPCCGSAGTYNLLQPDLSRELGSRLAAAIHGMGGDAVATGNIGCLMQIAQDTRLPVLHTVELLDWATGGPRPKGI